MILFNTRVEDLKHEMEKYILSHKDNNAEYIKIYEGTKDETTVRISEDGNICYSYRGAEPSSKVWESYAHPLYEFSIEYLADIADTIHIQSSNQFKNVKNN